MIGRAILGLMLSVCVVGGAAAQYSGTPQDQRACSRDVKRYCAKVLNQGDMGILGCLQQNRPRLSASCKQMLVRYGQ